VKRTNIHMNIKTVSLDIAEVQRLALQFHKLRSLPEAEMLYRRILDTAPDTLDVLHFLSLLCHHQGRNEEAAQLIHRIIEIAPNNFDAHNNLGNICESLQRFDEAEECYRRSLAIKSDHAPALNNLGVILMAQMKTQEAIELYRRAVGLAPEDADFRYNLGNALRKSGQTDEAIAVYREAIELNSNHEGAWRGLARSYLLQGRRKEAAEAFEEWLRLDPGNELARYMRAALLGEGASPRRAPDAYICRTFDAMAHVFDNHLVENLEYRAPDVLGAALSAALPPPSLDMEILDAGCGTGLCAPFLKPYAKRLTGVDLSDGMISVARARKAYDDLITVELTEFLNSRNEAYDIIASADTLCYFGPLEPVFGAAARALKPLGILAFTLEDAGDDAVGWRLDQTARYVHSHTYVETALKETGFAIHSLSSAVLRKEHGQPVTGHVVVARKAN
jgi:predicted TPR repeat methyltransferase